MKNVLHQFYMGLAVIASVSSAYALAPPALQLTDDAGRIMTLDSTGAVTTAGTCTVSTCVTSYSSTATPGVILWGGVTIGNFTIQALVGLTKPSIAPASSTDVSVQGLRTASTGGGTLTIQWTDIDFSAGMNTVTGGSMHAGGNAINGTITYNAYVDGTNAAFGHGPPQIGNLVFSTAPFSGDATSSFSTTSPFSMTEELIFALGANGTGDGDFEANVFLQPAGGGCPATIGFWKNAKKHPFPSTLMFPVTIAGVQYSSADFYTILSGDTSGGNAVAIMGKQLIGALLNIAAGAVHSGTVDTAITNAETLLLVGLPGNNPPGVVFPINMTSAFVQSSTALGTAMTTVAGTLDGYNNANFDTCSEGTGLMLGSPSAK
jgi:hypothetical protein